MIRKILAFAITFFPFALWGLEGSTDKPLLVKKTCAKHGEIEGVKYCIQESSITLNGCGKQSDWPCMEEGGCLDINRWVLNDEKP